MAEWAELPEGLDQSPGPGPLGILTPADLELLLNLSYRVPVSAGEVLVAQGERLDRIFLLEAGSLVAEDEHGSWKLEAGSVFGAASLAHAFPSPARLHADVDATVIALSRREVDWLVAAEPSTAARLLQVVASATAMQQARGTRPPAAVPDAAGRPLDSLAEACSQARLALHELGEAPEENAVHWANERISAVSNILRPVLRAVARQVDSVPAHRATAATAARTHLRELLASSRLVELMTGRPAGSPPGFRSFNHIYRQLPQGDDSLGLLIDAWLLSRPFAEAIRERRTLASTRLSQEVLERARPGKVARILSLGCGPARSLADLLEEPGMSEKIAVVCVDDDRDALVHANNLLKGRAPRGDISFRQAPPADLALDTDALGVFDIIASLYTADNIDLASLGRILHTAHRWLHAYGVLELVFFGDAVPDWLLLELLFDWTPQRHNLREIQDVVARSPFGASRAEVRPTPSGLNVVLRAVK